MREEITVNIKEKLFTYASDFPNGWVFAKGDYFKKTDIDKYACFTKRFEVKTPDSISAWQLMVNLKGKNEYNLARLYDIAGTRENGRNVYYVFYEFIEGDTLHKLVADHIDVDLVRLTDDLFSAIQSLQNKGYWFADFVEKNIFWDRRGKFVLIDLDSAQPVSKAPDNDMWADKEYWALVFSYYKEVLGKQQLTYSDVHGINLNYLIIIFLILRLKIHQFNRAKEYHDIYNDLPGQLDRISGSFRKVFDEVFQKQSAVSPDIIDEIRNLIKGEIISITIQGVSGPIEGWRAPIIKNFKADKDVVSAGEPFQLVWDAENASTIELYKDEALYKKISPAENHIKLNEGVEGNNKEVKYTLKAYNNSSSEQSRSVIVKFTSPAIQSFAVNKKRVNSGETFTLHWDVVHATNTELYRNRVSYRAFNPAGNSIQLKEEASNGNNAEVEYRLVVSDGYSTIKSNPVTVILRGSRLLPPVFKISLGVLALVFLLGLFYFYRWQKGFMKPANTIDPFTSAQITEHDTITSTGKNLPTFNNVYIANDVIDEIKPSLIKYSNRNVKVQLENGSSHALDKVVVGISYVGYGNDGVTANRLLYPKHETLIFENMQAGAKLALDVPYLYRASEVKVSMKSVEVKKTEP